MFFYKLIRTSGEIRLENYLYSQERFLIIPIISPTSPAGQALLSDDNLLLVTEAFDRANADLIYISRNDEQAYGRFVSGFLDFAHKVEDLRTFKDPMIVVITPNEWEMFLIGGLRESDRDELKEVLWGIASCISSRNASKKLKRFIKKRRLSSFYSQSADLVNSILSVMQIAVTVLSRPT